MAPVTTLFLDLDTPKQQGFTHNYEMWKDLTSYTNLIMPEATVRAPGINPA